MTHNRRRNPPMFLKKTSWIEIHILIFVLWLAAAGANAGETIRCSPVVQYTCDKEKCERQTDGFQHAESFTYDFESGILRACLWTNCYAAKGQIYRSPEGKESTIIGKLVPENMPDRYSQMIVSMSVDTDRNFVAVWQYSGQGLTFDQGRCTK